MGSRYIEVPADALMGMLREVGEAVEGAGGSYAEGTQGREVVVDITPKKPNAPFVRVYTSLAKGRATVRECGEDAIRIVVGHHWIGEDGKERFGPLARSRKFLRTAPKGTPEERLAAFLERLKEALRTAYREAQLHPSCPTCGKLMRLRRPKPGGRQFKPFWGCTGYPSCRTTMVYQEPSKKSA